MTKLLLHPPEGVHAFTFHHGCGKPHQYDGVHGIDCGPCTEQVRLMAPEERILHPHLRVPLVATGDTPGEIDTMRRVEEAKRDAASWRLVEAEAESDEGEEDEKAALKARIRELEAAAAKAPATRRAASKA